MTNAGKPRLVHVLGPLEASGAERLLEVLAPVANLDAECHIISTGDEGIGAFAPALRKAGYQVHHVPFRRSIGFVHDMFRALRHIAPDILHIHCERAFVWIALAGSLTGTPRLVRTIHSTFFFTGTLRIRRRFQRWIVRVCLGLRSLSVSPSVARNELDRFANPSDTMPTFLDHARFAIPTPERRRQARASFGLEADQIAVALVGSCQALKNHEAAIRMTALLRDRGLDIVLLHAGSGLLEEHEKHCAAEAGVGVHVRFLGVVPDVERVLQAADIFLMPSEYEGLGVAAIEALAVGLPAVLSEAPGLRDVAQYGGEIRWSGTAPAELAAAVSELVHSGPKAPIPQSEKLRNSTPESAWAFLKQIYALGGTTG